MPECIICRQDREAALFHEEHVFPEAIGGTYIIRTVCDGCNSYFGETADNDLVDHWLVAASRLAYGVKGKSHVPNPLSDGVLADLPEVKVYHLLDDKGRPKGVQVVPNVKKATDDRAQRIEIVIDGSEADKLPEMVNKIRSRAGYPPLPAEEILATAQTQTVNSEIRFQFTLDLLQYKLGLLKIAYELSATWLGPMYSTDPCGEVIRSCLLDRDWVSGWQTKYRLTGDMRLLDSDPSVPYWNAEPTSHIGLLTIDGGDVWCYLRVFLVAEARIRVSEQAGRYEGFEDRFLAIEACSGKRRESTFQDELHRRGRGGS